MKTRMIGRLKHEHRANKSKVRGQDDQVTTNEKGGYKEGELRRRLLVTWKMRKQEGESREKFN